MIWFLKERKMGFLRKLFPSKKENSVSVPIGKPGKGHFLYHYLSTFDADAVIRKYEDTARVATPDYVTNFLGVRIDESPHPQILTPMLGTVEDVPDPGNWHADIVEWASVLRAVDEAQSVFRLIEVGCGWGCWMNNLGVAAKRAGLDIALTGIEGSAEHLAIARALMALNDLSEDETRLVHGVAASKSDRALFPRTDKGGYGAVPVFFPDEIQYKKLMKTGAYEELKTFTLSEVSHGKVQDLMHVDIQGSEISFVEGNWDEISRLVRRIFVGTHGRVIDGALMAFFLEKGWVLEAERPSYEEIRKGKLVLMIDGAQLWRNPQL